MTPQEQQIIAALLGPGPQMPKQAPQVPPMQARPPLGADRSFAPGPGVRVADAQGSAFGGKITPSGVGEQNTINSAAYAYNALMNSLKDYSANFQPGPDGEIPNVPMMPGVERDRITAQRRNIQMQMKELYNLGVLNGPDLELMDQIMFNPLSLKNKALDVTGIADSEERASANVAEIEKMMRDMVAPKLKASGVAVEDVYSDDMSEEDFAKWLAAQ